MAYRERNGAYDGLNATAWQKLRAKFRPADDVVQEVARLRSHMTLSEAFNHVGAAMPENAGWDDLLDAVAHIHEVVRPQMRGVGSGEANEGIRASGVPGRGGDARADGRGVVVPLRAAAAGGGEAARAATPQRGARSARGHAPRGGSR